MTAARKPRVARSDAPLTLSEDERFGLEMQRLTRRVERIQALRRGDATIARVDISGVWVSRHYREPHTRILIVTKNKRRTTR